MKYTVWGELPREFAIECYDNSRMRPSGRSGVGHNGLVDRIDFPVGTPIEEIEARQTEIDASGQYNAADIVYCDHTSGHSAGTIEEARAIANEWRKSGKYVKVTIEEVYHGYLRRVAA